MGQPVLLRRKSLYFDGSIDTESQAEFAKVCIILSYSYHIIHVREIEHMGLDMSIRLPIHLMPVNRYHDKNRKILDVTKKDK